MNFLAPLFLLGALAVALPVIFHLIRRSVKERTLFSSLMFLLPSPPRLTRRSRLENLLLLALRCAVITLLALAFARPFLKQVFPGAVPEQSGRQLVVLLDTSASMRRQEIWDRARAKAEETVREAGTGATLALYTFDRQLRPVLSFDEWNRLPLGDRFPAVRSRLAELKPGWASTALDSALTEAAEMFREAGADTLARERQIVVISDFAEGSRFNGLQGHQWPKDVQVVQERVASRPANNATLRLLTTAVENEPGTASATRVQVSNASNSKAEAFRVGWAGQKDAFTDKPLDVYVPAGQSRTVTLNPPANATDSRRVLLTGDDETFDNSVWLVPPQKTRLTLAYLGDDSETDVRQPLFFLRRAIQDTPRQSVRIERIDVTRPRAQALIDEASLFVVSSLLEDAQISALKSALAQGKTLLLVPGNAAAAERLSKLLDTQLPAVVDHQPARYAMLGEIQFADPLFAPFADARYSDFTKIHFWKYRKMDFTGVPEARTLAKFDTGDPAIVSIPSGKGRIVVLASGWHPADSQLGLSSKFVPLLYSIIESSGAAPVGTPAQQFVGQLLGLTAGATLRTPSGTELSVKPGETNHLAAEPGIYAAAGNGVTSLFAVNLDPAEGRTTPLPLDELERLGVPGPAAAPVNASAEAERKLRLQNAELEARQKLWRWIVVATLALVLFETWLAGWTGRRTAVPEEAV